MKMKSISALVVGFMLAGALPATASTTVVNFAPTVTVQLDAGVITLTPPKSNSPAPMRVEISNPSIAKANGLVVTLLGVGSTVITYIQDATTGYTAATRPSHLVVTAGKPTFANFADQSIPMSQNTFTIEAPTSTSDGTFSYTSSNPSVLTIAGNIATIVDGGEATITATQSPTGKWLSGSVNKKVTITAPTPTVSSIPDVTLSITGISSFEMRSPVSTSDAPWTFTSNNPAIVSISGSRFNAVAPGEVTITAKQARNQIYRSYITTFKVTVVAVSPKISLAGFEGTTISLSSSVQTFSLYTPLSESTGIWRVESSDPSIVSVDNITALHEIQMTARRPGQVKLTAVQAATGNYAESAPISISITIKGVPKAPTLETIERVAGDPNVVINIPSNESIGKWTLESSNPAVVTVSGSSLVITGAGSATVVATQAETDIWKSINASFVVRIAGITPTLGAVSPISLGVNEKSVPTQLPSSNSSGKWNFESSNTAVVNVVGGVLVGVSPGTAMVSAFQDPLGKYGRSNTVSIPVTVKPAPQTSALSAIVVTLRAATVITNPISNSNGAWVYESANSSVAQISGNKVVGLTVGTTTLTARQLPTASFAGKTQTVKVTVVAPPAPSASASASGRTIKVTVAHAASSAFNVTINGVKAKVGTNPVGPGTRKVVVKFGSKVVLNKTFAIK